MASLTARRVGAKPTPPHVAAVSLSGQPSTKPIGCLFNGLGDHDITYTMKSGGVGRFAAGGAIVRADDPGMHLSMLKTGSIDYNRTAPEGQQVLSYGFPRAIRLARNTARIGTAEALRQTRCGYERAWPRSDRYERTPEAC